MAWNAGSTQHPPPPPGGPHPPPPPPPPPPPGPNPFWNFIHSMDPNYRAGYGVDHTGPNFPNGFTFGPEGFEAWAGPRGFRGDWGRRGRHGPWHGYGRGGPRGSWGWGWSGDLTGGGPEDWDDGHGHGHDRRRSRGGRGWWGRGREDDSADDEMRDAGATGDENEKDAGEHDPEKEGSPTTMRGDGPSGGEFPDPPEETPEAAGLPIRERGGRGCGRRGRGGFGRHGPRGVHGHGHGHSRGPHPPPPGPGGVPPPPYGAPHGGPPFDFNALMAGLAGHPFAQRIRQYVERNLAQQRGQGERGVDNDNDAEDDIMGGENTFVPPIDIFNAPNAWTVHVALPGAKKEDVAVNWDAHKGTLAVSGVVYRPGDEEFLAGIVTGERKVGLFDRKIKLPPVDSDERDEVEPNGISARMEDGILIITVPKVEKEWTEVKKVDIE